MKTTTKLLLMAVALGLLSAMSCTPVSAQKIDTTKTVPVHYSEIVRILGQIQRAQLVYHRLDIPALKRDTIDMYLGDVINFFNRRADVVYADTVKKTGKKK